MAEVYYRNANDRYLFEKDKYRRGAADQCAPCCNEAITCADIEGTKPTSLILNVSTYTGDWCPYMYGDWPLDQSGNGYDFWDDWNGTQTIDDFYRTALGSQTYLNQDTICHIWWGDLDCTIGPAYPGAPPPPAYDCARVQLLSSDRNPENIPVRQSFFAGVVDYYVTGGGVPPESRFKPVVGVVTQGSFGYTNDNSQLGPVIFDNTNGPPLNPFFTNWGQLHNNLMNNGGAAFGTLLPWCRSRTAYKTLIA